MVKHKLRFGVSVSLIVAGSVATTSIASDRTQCHDLPAKQTVLDEGKELLRQQSNGSWADMDFHNLPPQKRFMIETYPNQLYSANYRSTGGPDAKTVRTLPLETIVQLKGAIETAEKLECYLKANSANVLFTRILSSDKFEQLTHTEQASVIEGTARTKITCGLKESPAKLFDWIDQMHFYYMGHVPALTLRRMALEAITKAELSNEDTMQIKGLCAKAAQIRRKLKSTEELATDLLLLGALSEKTNDLSDAMNYFYQAMLIIQKSEQKQVGDDALAMIVSTQIRANLVVGKNYSAFRAVKLFEDNCLNKAQHPTIISAQSLLSVLDVLPAKDIPALVDYLPRIIGDRNQTSVTRTNFTSILRKMKARGWGTECNTICELTTNQFNIDSLFMVANWYTESKDDVHLVDTAKLILNAIPKNSDEEALASLKLLTTLLASVSTAQPELSTIKGETAKRTSYYEDEIRRKQCLHMADNLNETAFRLERKAQPEMASKLYKEALEIKQMNLKSDDPDTAAQLVDLARAEAAQGKFEQAQLHYEKALTILRKNSMADPADTVSALESYGMMLNDWNHGAKATKVYEEAKALHDKMKQPKPFSR